MATDSVQASAMPHAELHTSRLLLRPARAADLEPLTSILAEPSVSAHWPDFDRARVADELIAVDDEVQVLIIELRESGATIGAIQYSENDDPQYRHAGIDLFLGTRFQGQGLGSEAIRTVVDHLFQALGHHRITIDPAAHNQRAVRAYERIGFRRVGLLRQYERGPDGSFHDGLLMELLRADLRQKRAPAAAPTGLPCVLRLAMLSDVPSLLEMMVAFNRHEGISWNAEDGEAPLRHLITDDNLGFVVVLGAPGATVAGYAVVTFGYDLEFGGRDAFLTEFFLLDKVRGQGLGRQALKLVLDEVQARGGRALHLQVRAENIAAQRLYLDAGFAPTTRIFLSRLLYGEDESSAALPNS